MAHGCEGMDLAAIERAAVASWPALEATVIDGWLARVSSGGSVRANTVSALDYSGTDLDRSIAAVTAFYRSRGSVPRFTITQVSQPSDLDQRLEAAGWERGGDHVTMAKMVDGGEGCCEASGLADVLSVVPTDQPTAGWMAVYLAGLSESRRAVAPQLVSRVPQPRTFFACVRGGEVIASGLSAIDGRLASVQCMATSIQARRVGAARAILRAIERTAVSKGCRRLYLQTELDNTSAVSLYVRAGFAVAGRYHVRTLVG
ncbi:MAG: GNAT family N-acetyltransferase [Hyphomicrobiaceae bacterium]